MSDSIGVVHGRFQLLHHEHMKYILAAKERCDHLIIGISNPDITLTRYDNVDPHRSEKSSNPFSYYERFQMLQGSVTESGVGLSEFDIVPFPINYPEHIFNYVPRNAIFYMTIYDEWGLEKKKTLEKLGCSVEILWQRDISQKVISSTDIRQCIRENRPWEQFVPPFVYNYILAHNLDERIIKTLIK